MNLTEFKKDMDNAWHSDDDVSSRLRVFEEAIESILESEQSSNSSPIPALGGTADVQSGFAAINFPYDGWKGIIAGNRYCKRYRATSAEALADAKEMFEQER